MKNYIVAVFDMTEHGQKVTEGLECSCFPGLITAWSSRPLR